MKQKILISLLIFTSVFASAEDFELLPYGNFNTWVTRNIKESFVIGGKERVCYAIGPEMTINGATAYKNAGGSPWGSSNVMAKVVGIVKVSNAVFPAQRSGSDRCVKMTTIMEHCKAIGLINIDVLVSGSIFLGEMMEPISSTSSPYSKMKMGIPFTKRPKAVQFDYKVLVPENGKLIYCSGFGSKKVLEGKDNAEAFLLLQRRWEDAEGNIHAKRVGTYRERFDKSTDGWVNGHRGEILYGDITGKPEYKNYMKLIPEEKSYYSMNSKGKMVPVVEEGWDSPDATPTHAVMMFSSGCGEAYVGMEGMAMWVDNVGMVY